MTSRGSKKKYVTGPQDKWEQKHVSANQIGAINNLRDTLYQEIERFRGTDIAKEVSRLRNMVKSRDDEIETLKDEISGLTQDVQNEQARVENIYDVIRSCWGNTANSLTFGKRCRSKSGRGTEPLTEGEDNGNTVRFGGKLREMLPFRKLLGKTLIPRTRSRCF